MMADLFKDIIPSILQHKQDVLDNEKDYVPYIVNRALSLHYDCIMLVDQMNMYPGLDNKLQYHFYLNRIRAYKRPYQKWHKKETIDNLDAIKEYYKCSNEKAKEIISILSQEQLDEIKQKTDKGGLDHARTKRTNRGEVE